MVNWYGTAGAVGCARFPGSPPTCRDWSWNRTAPDALTDTESEPAAVGLASTETIAWSRVTSLGRSFAVMVPEMVGNILWVQAVAGVFWVPNRHGWPSPHQIEVRLVG